MLIAHYPLNGDARDYFGNATTVNGSSGISYIDGKIGRAISFDNSSTGYLSAPEISTYLHGKPEASIALWVKKSAVQYGFLQLSGYSSSNGNLYPYDTSTKVYLDIFRTNRLGPIYMPTSVLEWHHLVITQKPGQWKLYQNGVLVNTSGADDTVSTDYLQFELGRNSGSRYAFGDFDDVRIYDHALSEKEVSDLALGLSGSFKANTEIQSFSDATGTCNSQSLPAAVTAIIEDSIPTFYFDGNNGLDTGKLYNFKQTDSFATFFEINIRDHSDRDSAAAGVIGKAHYYSNSWSVYVRNNNTLAFETSGDPTRSGINTVNTPALALNTWHKVCCVYRNGQKEIHLNGSIVDTGTYSGPGDLDNTNTLKLGVRRGDSSRSLRGKLRNVKVFSTDLTQSAIDSLFQTGLSIDNTGNMHSKHFIEGSSALSFDGDGDYVQIPHSSNLDTDFITVEYLVKPKQKTHVRPFVNRSGNPGEQVAPWRFLMQNPGGEIFGWNVSINNTTISVASTTAFNTETLYHIVGTFDGSEAAIYVNGVKEGTTLASGVMDKTTNPIEIARNAAYNPSRFAAQESGFLRIYNRALNPSEVTANYNHQRVTSGLVSEWKLDEGSGTTVIDSAGSNNGTVFNATWTALQPSRQPSIEYSQTGVNEFSEVGVSRGLVSWFPLTSNTKDRVTNEVATNNGAIAVGDGYEFDGSGEIDGSPTGDYISIPEAITNTSTNNYPEGCTYSVWLNVDTDAVDRMGLFWGSGTIRHIEIYSIGKNFRTEAATQNGYSFGSSSFPDDVRGVWSNFTIVFANGEAGRPVRWYQNGKLFHTGSMTSGSNPEGEYFSFSGLGRATGSGSYTYAKSFDGKIRGFRIYENTLTPEEVAQEYRSGKASLNKNTAFAKEFIEV